MIEAWEDLSSFELAASSSLIILVSKAYKASGSLRIASEGEPFFLDLTGDLTFLVDEEAGASGTAFCTGVVILNGEAFERKSLVTLLIMELVWENLSHHLTYQ